ncbi:hypothetical protein [Thiolapillus sp.]|uniref:hypothetical protein n=1 Tax=Thiolapillus sp. TaxID=2017437 RepID=UPI003AF75DF9
MRYFLLVFRAKALLPLRIVEPSRSTGPVFFSGTATRFGSGDLAAFAETIALSPVTTGTENDLRMAALAMVKTGG